MPPVQKPEAQGPPSEQDWPLGRPHKLVGPHVFGLAQVSGSGALATVMHAPTLAPLHVWQTPSQAASQQTPSAQKREAHCAALVHECALGEPQSPVEPHVFAPVHVSGSEALVTGEQTPGFPAVSHAMHVPAHVACSQQTPSTQAPVSHSVPKVQAPPCA